MMVSVTMETTGTMLVGSDISAVVTILEPYNIDVLGDDSENLSPIITFGFSHSPMLSRR